MIQLLQLMQLSDSAVPIGSASHSFGFESLAEWGEVQPHTLRPFLNAWMQQQATLDACFCRAAFTAMLAAPDASTHMTRLCRRLSAVRQARESREGSISLGQRLLAMSAAVLPEEMAVSLAAAFAPEDAHHCLVFGAMAAMLGIEEDLAVAAFLQQGIAMLTSASQRLMAVGQRQAAAEQWSLKQQVVDVVQNSRGQSVFTAGSFMPLSDIGSMRHPQLETRLFLT